MNALTIFNTEVTMTSLEMVDFINSQRGDDGSELRHRDLTAKVPKVLGEEMCEKFRTSLPDAYGREQPGYRFPKREACLMAMSYSYDLQAKVFDRMTELESSMSTKQPSLSNPYEIAVTYIESTMKVATLFRVPEHYAQTEAVKGARLLTGCDFSPLLKLAPAQNNIKVEEAMLEPTEIGSRCGLSAIKVNRLLEAEGYQLKFVPGSVTSWTPTEKGKPYSSVHHWQSGAKTGYNLKWNVSFVLDLVEKSKA